MIYGIWHGGHGHGPTDLERDVERFDTIEDAERALLDRYQDQFSRHHFQYANRGCANVFTPDVGEDTYMDVYLALDVEDGTVLVHNNGPDLRLTINENTIVFERAS